jgi:hypothetical protein
VDTTFTSERFDDVDPDGEYDYRGEVYFIRVGNRWFTARRYDDAPREASFMNWFDSRGSDEAPTIDGLQLGSFRGKLFEAIPYQDDRFVGAVRRLRDEAELDTIKILLPDGYQELDVVALARR